MSAVPVLLNGAWAHRVVWVGPEVQRLKQASRDADGAGLLPILRGGAWVDTTGEFYVRRWLPKFHGGCSVGDNRGHWETS